MPDLGPWTLVRDDVPQDGRPYLLAHASEKYPDIIFQAVSTYDVEEGTWYDELTSDPLTPIAWTELPSTDVLVPYL